MRIHQEQDDSNVSFQIAPMVDVVFILMLFFMASAALQEREAELVTNLPASSGAPQQTTIYEISIAENGLIFFGARGVEGEKMDSPDSAELPQLEGRIRGAMQGSDKGAKTPFILKPDGDATHQRIVDVLNTCKKAGAESISFQ